MSCQYNETIMERIEQEVLTSGLQTEDLLKELGMTYEDAYAEKIDYNRLIDLVVLKRFDECPQI